MNNTDKTITENKIVSANENLNNSNPSKNKKSKKISIIMFVVNVLIVLAILLYNIINNQDFTPLSELNFNFNFFGIVIIITFMTIMIDSLITRLFIKKSNENISYFLGYRSYTIMKYYDSITPMGAGGQPFMAAYLMNHGISGTTSVSVPVKKFLMQQFSWLIITAVALINTLITKSITNPLILFFSIFGFSINLFLDTFILLASSSEKITKSLTISIIRFLTKIKIIKNYDKALDKSLQFMSEYQTIMKEFSENKKQFFLILLLGIIKNAIYFSIPFFIYCCFESFDIGLFITFFTFAAMVELASSCFPLPGGSGMNEITFSVLFNQYLPSAVFWAMLLWRLCSYYIYIIMGILVMASDLFDTHKLKNKSENI